MVTALGLNTKYTITIDPQSTSKLDITTWSFIGKLVRDRGENKKAEPFWSNERKIAHLQRIM